MRFVERLKPERHLVSRLSRSPSRATIHSARARRRGEAPAARLYATSESSERRQRALTPFSIARGISFSLIDAWNMVFTLAPTPPAMICRPSGECRRAECAAVPWETRAASEDARASRGTSPARANAASRLTRRGNSEKTCNIRKIYRWKRMATKAPRSRASEGIRVRRSREQDGVFARTRRRDRLIIISRKDARR